MAAIRPWFRGYRRARRDVKYGIAQHAHSIKGDEHKRPIYFSITMELAFNLQVQKREESEFRQLMYRKEAGFKQEVSNGLPWLEIPQRVLL